MEKFPEESYIKSVDAGAQTGGNIFNDVITLKNGMIIRISGDVICIFKGLGDDIDGEEPLAFADMLEDMPEPDDPDIAKPCPYCHGDSGLDCEMCSGRGYVYY